MMEWWEAARAFCSVFQYSNTPIVRPSQAFHSKGPPACVQEPTSPGKRLRVLPPLSAFHRGDIIRTAPSFATTGGRAQGRRAAT